MKKRQLDAPEDGLCCVPERRGRQRLPDLSQQHQQAVVQHVAPVALHLKHVLRLVGPLAGVLLLVRLVAGAARLAVLRGV
eukprot:scaffold495649_cov29-Prasinocladus_malaysianus.AAC.1